jgi:hypothetical protein
MHDPGPCSVRHDRGRIRFALDSRVGGQNLFVIWLSKPPTRLGLATIRFLSQLTCTVSRVSHTEMSCPACGSLDSSRDGFRIRLLDDGSLLSLRASVPSDSVSPWVCEACGHRLVIWGALSALLNGARLRVDET